MATHDEYGDFPNWGLRLLVGFGVGVGATVAVLRLAFGGAATAMALVDVAGSVMAEVTAEVEVDLAAEEALDEGDEDDPSPQGVYEAPAAATAFVGEDVAPLVAFDPAYCDALSDLWRSALSIMLAAPAQGDWPSFPDDMAALAASIDGVAATAPTEHRGLLTNAAESYRALGDVPWEQARFGPLFNGDQTLGFPTDAYFEHVCMHRADTYG
ncbi:MAG: hypothetical protein AAF962_08900 [Actinomycetota bacterium]